MYKEIEVALEKIPVQIKGDFRKKLIKFQELLKDNRIALFHNFWCCNTCASYGIFSKLDKLTLDYDGYLFYHEQAKESYVGDESLYFGWGLLTQEDNEDAEIAFGHKIVALAEQAGFFVRWESKNSSTKIAIK